MKNDPEDKPLLWYSVLFLFLVFLFYFVIIVVCSRIETEQAWSMLFQNERDALQAPPEYNVEVVPPLDEEGATDLEIPGCTTVVAPPPAYMDGR